MWGTIAMAGLGAVGGLLGSRNQQKNNTTTSSSAPWSVQQPYLQRGFQEAGNALTNAQNVGAYEGPWTPDINANLTGGWDNMVNWSQQAAGTGQAITGAGMTGVNNFGQNVANANDLYNRAMVDPTQGTINAANAYANNPSINGMIDASLRDVNRNLQLGTGQNNSNAVGVGGMNSTRAGVTEALLTQGAQDRAADIAAGIRGNAWNQGLQLGANQLQQGFQNALGANAQGMSAANMGSNMAIQGAGLGQQAAGAQIGVGAQQYGYDEKAIAGAQAQNNYARNQEFDLLDRYMRLVGGNYGSQSTSTAPNPNYRDPMSSMLQGAIGGGMMGYGMFGGGGLGMGGAQGYPVQVPGTSPTGYGNYVAPNMAQYYP